MERTIARKLIKETCEFSVRRLEDLKSIAPGCTFCSVDTDPEIIDRFETNEEALKALVRYASDIRVYPARASRGYSVIVTEYMVVTEDVEIDEDGEEFVNGCTDMVDVTPFVDEISVFGETYAYDVKWGWIAKEEGEE